MEHANRCRIILSAEQLVPVCDAGGGNRSNRCDACEAFPFDDTKSITVQGRHLLEGELRSINISDEEIREALEYDVALIVNAVRSAIEISPPDLAADMADRGIILTGGGALLNNLDRRLKIELGLPVTMAEDAQTSVVLGLGKTLSDFELHKRMKLGNPVYSSGWEP